jgi:hypothetical protein
MQIIRECRMRAAILTSIARDDPELRIQLLYVAKEWLTLADISEQLNADADRAGHKLPALPSASTGPLSFQTKRAMSAFDPKRTFSERVVLRE